MKISFTILIVLFAFSGFSKEWLILDDNLEVRFNDKTALISVKDKRSNKTWQQLELTNNIRIEKTVQNGKKLRVNFSGEYNLEVSIALTESSALEFELIAEEKLPFEKLSSPPAFQTPDKNHYLVFTDGEGFLLRADDTEYGIGRQIMHSMRGLSMPWMGVTDTDFKTGYMAVVETPDDCEIWVKSYNRLISFEPLWISQKGNFGYNRKISYHFFNEGGYVAQCKTYRDYVWAKNEVPPTLKEKQKRFPAIEKMIGAVHIYLWDEA